MKKIIFILTIFAAALLINVASEASVIKTDRIYIYFVLFVEGPMVLETASQKKIVWDFIIIL